MGPPKSHDDLVNKLIQKYGKTHGKNAYEVLMYLINSHNASNPKHKVKCEHLCDREGNQTDLGSAIQFMAANQNWDRYPNYPCFLAAWSLKNKDYNKLIEFVTSSASKTQTWDRQCYKPGFFDYRTKHAWIIEGYKDGAWICCSSWGSTLGNKGHFSIQVETLKQDIW